MHRYRGIREKKEFAKWRWAALDTKICPTEPVNELDPAGRWLGAQRRGSKYSMPNKMRNCHVSNTA